MEKGRKDWRNQRGQGHQENTAHGINCAGLMKAPRDQGASRGLTWVPCIHVMAVQLGVVVEF